MTRVVGIPREKAGLFARISYWFCKQKIGKLLEPLKVMAHNNWILAAVSGFELANEKAKSVDIKLKELAQIRAAMLIGCPF